MIGCAQAGRGRTEAPATYYLREDFDYPDGVVPAGWVMLGAPDTVTTFVVESGVFTNAFSGPALAVYTGREFDAPAIYRARLWLGDGPAAAASLIWRLSDPDADAGAGLAAEIATSGDLASPDTLRFVRLSWTSGFATYESIPLADTLVDLGTGFQLMSVYDCGDSAWISAGVAVELAVSVPPDISDSGRLGLGDLGHAARVGFDAVYVTSEGGPPRCDGARLARQRILRP